MRIAALRSTILGVDLAGAGSDATAIFFSNPYYSPSWVAERFAALPAGYAQRWLLGEWVIDVATQSV